MKKLLCVLSACLLLSSCTWSPKKQGEESFKDVFAARFYVGAAMDTGQINGTDLASLALIKEQFNTITPENHMKAENIHPKVDEYDFEMADKFVNFGIENNMKIVGHALIWHSQLPDWFFLDDNGEIIGKEELIARMKAHISTVVGRYKGRVDAWDVVNEAILDDGSYRPSLFYKILGEDFIKYAFEFAHEADPEAELYYNDFSMNKPDKREGVVKMVRGLQADGIRIDGIGMQGHYHLADDEPTIEEIEESILAFASTGVQVMFTELDITVLPSAFAHAGGANVSDRAAYQERLNPYKEGMPDSVMLRYNKRYIDLFKLFVKHQDVIDRVTFWGVTDHQSWKNNWPVSGRTDYPLLFDRNYKAKPVVEDILKL